MPSCLLVLIFIYRFSSFSLPFLCTDGTLQLASHSTSSLTSPPLNTLHILLLFFCYNIRYFWTLQYMEAMLWQRPCAAGEQVLAASRHPKAIKVTVFPYTSVKRSWYRSRRLSDERGCQFYQRIYYGVYSVQYESAVCFMDVDFTHIESWLWVMSQEMDWFNKYIVWSLLCCIVDSVIPERCNEGDKKKNKSKEIKPSFPCIPPNYRFLNICLNKWMDMHIFLHSMLKYISFYWFCKPFCPQMSSWHHINQLFKDPLQ